MSDTVIKVENLSKRYTIGHQKNQQDGLRHQIEHAVRNPFQWFRGQIQNRRMEKEEFWALKDISFEVKHGEVLGVIGCNGAGKSTLLKILSRITQPTCGRVRLTRRVASLLEVGTGFHPELTGRENIFLNGAILGMRKTEIQRKFDEIVAFSEVEQFLDTPVKRYSSGMYVRLAFAVAAHLEAELLLIDEVLAVGDVSFQKKCLQKMDGIARGGRTVLFVSHNMDAIRMLCGRAILFENGKIRSDGDVESVVEGYFAGLSSSGSGVRLSNFGLEIQKVTLKNDEGRKTTQFCPGDDLIVEIEFDAQKPLKAPYFILVVQGKHGNCFTANMLLDGRRPKLLKDKGLISCRFKSIPLLPQRYTIRVAIRADNGKDILLDSELASFTVAADLADYGYQGEFVTLASVSTPVIIPYEWQLPDGTTTAVALTAPVSAV
jgi:lipopolysaccharide transport system ATP-binding protein